MDRNATPMWADSGDGCVVGYMCLTDFEYELGMASGGSTVYPSEEDCRKSRRCVAGCGIAEVEVRARRIVHAGRDDWA